MNAFYTNDNETNAISRSNQNGEVLCCVETLRTGYCHVHPWLASELVMFHVEHLVTLVPALRRQG